jgi:hypothetical protein
MVHCSINKVFRSKNVILRLAMEGEGCTTADGGRRRRHGGRMEEARGQLREEDA